MVKLTSNKIPLDNNPGKLGELRDSSALNGDFPALRKRIAEDGYLLMRGLLDREVVLAARREILLGLESVGELDPGRPVMEAISSGRSERGRIDQQEFLRDLRTGPAVRELCHSGNLRRFYDGFFGEPSRPLDYIWVRTVPVGGFTGIHYDWVYMGRGTRNLHTSWIPVGDVSREEGSLLILENSHRHEQLQNTYGALDVDRDEKKYKGAEGGWYSEDPVTVRNELGGRWLTTDFEAGDFLVFGMFTLHCSLDNNSPLGRIRVTIDTRYQPASEPADERWVGPEPLGHVHERK